MRLSLRQVEAFRIVVQTGSVSRAAERLFISQPAVSRLIADMEESVGLKLFDRARRFQLTAEGRQLFREVEQAFSGLEWIAKRAEDIATFRVGHLRIAASPALALGFLPPIIREFKVAHEGVSLVSLMRNSPDVAQWVANGQIEVGFAALPVNQSGVRLKTLQPLPAICMVPKNHRLSTEPFLTPALLADEPIISLGSESMLRRLIDDAFARAGVSVLSSVESMMSAQAAMLVHEGLGIAIIDPFTAVAFQHPGLVLKALHPLVPYEYAMLMPEHAEPSRLAQAFIETALKRGKAVQRAVEEIYGELPG
ncbi:LysR substrate-binding domain-containing protein [Caballeronia zhejiangensis]|jgi:DNA-binding transcriptional LysR family regulator|uniref:LysR substrate-binding domain-containing protein n=1 Tax=Caballeronia zhejiangensis TaxID=871203 RepID=UPI001FD2BE0E|nr:LysR substrate-binding domain-containing protein [Caballeronia zhejiangensis]